MEFHGEQVVLDQVPNRVQQDHLARYNFLFPFIRGKKVLDIACGTGYGTSMYQDNGAEAYGIDLSEEAIQHAKEHYPRVNFQVGNMAQISFPDCFFDVVTSFESLEHVEKETGIAFLKEVKRVLKPGGLFFLSTPNKKVLSPFRCDNPYHLHEYTERELLDSIKDVGFSIVQKRGQRIKLVRGFADFLEKYVLKRRIDLYWIPTPANPVSYGFLQSCRYFFLHLKS